MNDNREYQRERNNSDQREAPSRRNNEEYLENHRRGATRGAVRGIFLYFLY